MERNFLSFADGTWNPSEEALSFWRTGLFVLFCFFSKGRFFFSAMKNNWAFWRVVGMGLGWVEELDNSHFVVKVFHDFNTAFLSDWLYAEACEDGGGGVEGLFLYVPNKKFLLKKIYTQLLLFGIVNPTFKHNQSFNWMKQNTICWKGTIIGSRWCGRSRRQIRGYGKHASYHPKKAAIREVNMTPTLQTGSWKLCPQWNFAVPFTKMLLLLMQPTKLLTHVVDSYLEIV